MNPTQWFVARQQLLSVGVDLQEFALPSVTVMLVQHMFLRYGASWSSCEVFSGLQGWWFVVPFECEVIRAMQVSDVWLSLFVRICSVFPDMLMCCSSSLTCSCAQL